MVLLAIELFIFVRILILIHTIWSIFNTALVHSSSSPTQWDESNGVYLGFDGQIHTLPDYMQHFYTDLSIWDVFRTQMPFIVFHDAQRANDIIHSSMLMVEQSEGDLPKWPLANGYTGCMIGSHADILISDLMMKQEQDSLAISLCQSIRSHSKTFSMVTRTCLHVETRWTTRK